MMLNHDRGQRQRARASSSMAQTRESSATGEEMNSQKSVSSPDKRSSSESTSGKTLGRLNAFILWTDVALGVVLLVLLPLCLLQRDTADSMFLAVMAIALASRIERTMSEMEILSQDGIESSQTRMFETFMA